MGGHHACWVPARSPPDPQSCRPLVRQLPPSEFARRFPRLAAHALQVPSRARGAASTAHNPREEVWSWGLEASASSGRGSDASAATSTATAWSSGDPYGAEGATRCWSRESDAKLLPVPPRPCPTSSSGVRGPPELPWHSQSRDLLAASDHHSIPHSSPPQALPRNMPAGAHGGDEEHRSQPSQLASSRSPPRVACQRHDDEGGLYDAASQGRPLRPPTANRATTATVSSPRSSGGGGGGSSGGSCFPLSGADRRSGPFGGRATVAEGLNRQSKGAGPGGGQVGDGSFLREAASQHAMEDNDLFTDAVPLPATSSTSLLERRAALRARGADERSPPSAAPPFTLHKRSLVQATLTTAGGYQAEVGRAAKQRRLVAEWARPSTDMPQVVHPAARSSRPPPPPSQLTPPVGASVARAERQSSMREHLSDATPERKESAVAADAGFEDMPLAVRRAALKARAPQPTPETAPSPNPSDVCSIPPQQSSQRIAGAALNGRDRQGNVFEPAAAAGALQARPPRGATATATAGAALLQPDARRPLQPCKQNDNKAANSVNDGSTSNQPSKPPKQSKAKKAAAAANVATAPTKVKEAASTVPGTKPTIRGPQDLVVDISVPAEMNRFRQACGGANGCCVALLYSDEALTQFSSSLRPLTAAQDRALKKAQAAAATVTSDAHACAGVGGLPSAITLRGLAITLMHNPLVKAPTRNRVYFLKTERQRPPDASPPRLSAAAIPLLRDLFENPAVSAMCFNAQEVFRELLRAGLHGQVDVCALKALDPRVLTWLINPNTPPAESVAELAAELRILPATAEVPATVFGQLAEDLCRCCQLSDYLLSQAMQLADQLHGGDANVVRKNLEFEMAVVPLLAQLELTGLGFDPTLLEVHQQQLQERLARLQAEAAECLGGQPINLSSPSQVSAALYQHLALPKPSTFQQHRQGTSQLTTKDEVLRQLQRHHPLPGMVLEYRSIHKVLDTYIEPLVKKAAYRLDGTARLHCDWQSTRTATGRLAANDPNVQSIPKYKGPSDCGGGVDVNIRSAFVAAEGCALIACDYSQIELRMLAHISGDPTLVQLLRQSVRQGGDLFEYMWCTFHKRPIDTPVCKEDREKAKRTVYGIIYGQGPPGLASKLNISTKAAQDLIHKLYQHFPRVLSFVKETKERARRQRGTIVHGSSRFRPLPNIDAADQKLRSEAERRAVNTIIQGSAADLIKRAMVEWCASLASDSVRLVAQIHDELLVECPCDHVLEVSRRTKEVMEGVYELAVPLVVNVQTGSSWGNMRTLLL